MADIRTARGFKHNVEVMRPTAIREGLWSGEAEFQHAGSGAPVPVSQVFFVIRNDAGEPEAFASIARDLTLQKRAEAELRRFKALVDATSDFVGIARLAARRSESAMEYVNAAGMAMMGRAGEDCRVLTLGDLDATEASRRLDDAVFEALEASGISAASLLGSRCVVSGVSPAVAQTVTQLGLDVSSLLTFRTLKESLRFARASLAGGARALD